MFELAAVDLRVAIVCCAVELAVQCSSSEVASLWGLGRAIFEFETICDLFHGMSLL